MKIFRTIWMFAKDLFRLQRRRRRLLIADEEYDGWLGI